MNAFVVRATFQLHCSYNGDGMEWRGGKDMKYQCTINRHLYSDRRYYRWALYLFKSHAQEYYSIFFYQSLPLLGLQDIQAATSLKLRKMSDANYEKCPRLFQTALRIIYI